jgi:proton glutamate symport protein
MSNTTRILLALVVGLVFGIVFSDAAPALAESIAAIADPIGAMWLNGLRMTIVPLVVALLVTGIAQSAEAARAGRVAGLMIGSVIAILAISATVGMFLTPALLAIFPMPAGSGEALKAALGQTAAPAAIPPLGDFLKALVPTNPVTAAAGDAILPLIVFTTVFAFAVTRLPAAPRERLTSFFSAIADAMIVVIEWVLILAPIGVFALAFVVGARSGAAALGTLLHYVLIVSAVGSVMLMLSYPLAIIGGRVPFGRFARAVAPPQALAISTQSSLACLPIMIEKSRDLGVREATFGVTLPLAVALLRATGPAMNVAVVLYVANWYNVPIGPAQMAFGILVGTLMSLGAVSLPGTVSFITSCGPIALAMGVPLEPLALLIAVETLPDIMRTVGNVTADVAVTATIDARTREDSHEVSQTRHT